MCPVADDPILTSLSASSFVLRLLSGSAPGGGSDKRKKIHGGDEDGSSGYGKECASAGLTSTPPPPPKSSQTSLAIPFSLSHSSSDPGAGVSPKLFPPYLSFTRPLGLPAVTAIVILILDAAFLEFHAPYAAYQFPELDKEIGTFNTLLKKGSVYSNFARMDVKVGAPSAA